MNDFTKTDLTEIYRCLKYMTNGETTPYSCHTISLIKRVRTMIESYCEHECNGEVEIFVDTCRKCNAYLLREPHHEDI
jgi:hypothetical protein